MVKIWLMSSTIDDPRSECHRDPPEILSVDNLKEIGILYNYFDNKNGLESVAKARNYDYQDEVIINRDKLTNYDEKIQMFFKEHLHTDEEIRYVIDGCGYFDVRDKHVRRKKNLKKRMNENFSRIIGSGFLWKPEISLFFQPVFITVSLLITTITFM